MKPAQAFWEYVRIYQALRAGETRLHDGTPEADAARDQLDEPWGAMSEEQRNVVRWLLSRLDDDPPCEHAFVVQRALGHDFPEEFCRKCGLAEQYDTEFDGVHLKIRRRDRQPLTCGWDLLYAIKNLVVGPDVRMVEVFPPAAELVDEEHTRHLFVVPDGVLPPGLHGWGISKEPA